ncbi:MAG: hypothetical protein ABSB59_34055 [Streptosporangiaceae bacterium]
MKLGFHAPRPIGAALLGQEDRDEKRWLPMVRADRQLALERSQRLGHMTGASDYLYARSRELGPRPDGLARPRRDRVG